MESERVKPSSTKGPLSSHKKKKSNQNRSCRVQTLDLHHLGTSGVYKRQEGRSRVQRIDGNMRRSVQASSEIRVCNTGVNLAAECRKPTDQHPTIRSRQ